jgi:hypothetical protein
MHSQSSSSHFRTGVASSRRSFLFSDYSKGAEPETLTVSAVCPGGPARHFRVQKRPPAGGVWQNVRVCVESRFAEQAAEEWTRRGWRTRIIAYRNAPAAA